MIIIVIRRRIRREKRRRRRRIRSIIRYSAITTTRTKPKIKPIRFNKLLSFTFLIIIRVDNYCDKMNKKN